MIKVDKVSKSFNKKAVLNAISLQVNPGEICCLLGPSGAGKTTLIRLIIGALKADSGEITIHGVKVPSFSLYRDMGYMPQEDALYPDLSGIDNLFFFGGLYGFSRAKLKDRSNKVLSMLDLLDDKDKLVANYSGGMRKRLSLAVALLHEPKFLLLDEPTVGIDPILRQSIWQKLYQLRDEGKTIIVSTHVMDEAAKCDRSALIYHGSLIYDDVTSNLLAKTESGQIEELFFMAKEVK